MKKTASILLILLIIFLAACQDDTLETTEVPEPTVEAEEMPAEEALPEPTEETEAPEPTVEPTEIPTEEPAPEPTEADVAAEEPRRPSGDRNARRPVRSTPGEEQGHPEQDEQADPVSPVGLARGFREPKLRPGESPGDTRGRETRDRADGPSLSARAVEAACLSCRDETARRSRSHYQ